jgi:hypothetical protein
MPRGWSPACEIVAAARMMGDADEQRQPSRPPANIAQAGPRLGNPRSPNHLRAGVCPESASPRLYSTPERTFGRRFRTIQAPQGLAGCAVVA